MEVFHVKMVVCATLVARALNAHAHVDIVGKRAQN